MLSAVRHTSRTFLRSCCSCLFILPRATLGPHTTNLDTSPPHGLGQQQHSSFSTHPPISTMDSFLASIRPRLRNDPNAPVILVTGNESADLDSIVSALTSSLFLSRLDANKPKIVLPFINIPKADLLLRSDVEYILSLTKIDHELLFFREDLPELQQLVSKNQLFLFLVDHNKVSGTMDVLDKAPVVGLLDHHADEKLYQDTADPRRIEVVGSCASLVASQFFQDAIDHHAPKDLLTTLAQLLLAPILIDTQNLRPEAKKVQPLDVAMANLVYPFTGFHSRDHLYSKISEARCDTSHLSFYDLLRKDYKEWSVTHYSGRPVKVGISSIVGLMDKYVKRDGIDKLHQAVDEWGCKRDLDLFILMFSDDMGPDHGGYQRQIMIDPMRDWLDGFPAQFEKEPIFEFARTIISSMETTDLDKKGGLCLQQNNTACSRKQVWPSVEKLLKESPTSNL
ncbi:hypothetical protein B0O80DRAFT_502707 [Mortierella sp. GBAus27b]|nr:hypothetical protein B0O80DRAFT_502707 [Mortierella sp. GBAus27b]